MNIWDEIEANNKTWNEIKAKNQAFEERRVQFWFDTVFAANLKFAEEFNLEEFEILLEPEQVTILKKNGFALDLDEGLKVSFRVLGKVFTIERPDMGWNIFRKEDR